MLSEIRCVTESTTDPDKLLCLDGKSADKWNGCIDRGSVRVQCPQGFYPCNKLRDNGKEFICGEDCSNSGGKRECEFSYKWFGCFGNDPFEKFGKCVKGKDKYSFFPCKQSYGCPNILDVM